MSVAHRMAQHCMDAGSSGVCGEQALCGQPQHQQQSPALWRHAHALASGRCYGCEKLLCMHTCLVHPMRGHSWASSGNKTGKVHHSFTADMHLQVQLLCQQEAPPLAWDAPLCHCRTQIAQQGYQKRHTRSCSIAKYYLSLVCLCR